MAAAALPAAAAPVDARRTERAIGSPSTTMTFEQAPADTGLRDWIVGRPLDAQKRWGVDATPCFLVNGQLHEGEMSPDAFADILGS